MSRQWPSPASLPFVPGLLLDSDVRRRLSCLSLSSAPMGAKTRCDQRTRMAAEHRPLPRADPACRLPSERVMVRERRRSRRCTHSLVRRVRAQSRDALSSTSVAVFRSSRTQHVADECDEMLNSLAIPETARPTLSTMCSRRLRPVAARMPIASARSRADAKLRIAAGLVHCNVHLCAAMAA
jgi:hypothetical protein